jgi:hypothetical protein
VLFVDDEISAGTTAKVCLKALANSVQPCEKIDFLIVAEDQGFHGLELEGQEEHIKVTFVPFAPGIEGLSNVITYLIPYRIKKMLNNEFPDDLISPHKLCNILLDLPIRNKDIALSGFNYQLNQIAREKIPHLQQLQNEFIRYVRQLIQDAIQEYETGLINLADHEYVKQFIGD